MTGERAARIERERATLRRLALIRSTARDEGALSTPELDRYVLEQSELVERLIVDFVGDDPEAAP